MQNAALEAAQVNVDMSEVRTRVLDEGKGLPLLIEPCSVGHPDALADFVASRREWIESRLVQHGAILFRGFGISRGTEFENIAKTLEPNLATEYLGTSPRNRLPDCRHAFSASELPGFYPIPQHCEMSFLEHHPRRIFFCCLVPPKRGGETPLVDFRAVAKQLRPEVRERFQERGLRIIRNYDGPGRGGRFDLWKLKRWDEMFSTTDRSVVEEKARAEGLEPSWGPKNRLRLMNVQKPIRRHPETGEPVWFHHLQVFHLSAGPSELRRVWRLRRDARSLALSLLARPLVGLKRRFNDAEDQALHCTYGDGVEIAAEDVEHLRDVIWDNLVISPWQRGDLVMLDNWSVGHGRLPYYGDRVVAVCWAN